MPITTATFTKIQAAADGRSTTTAVGITFKRAPGLNLSITTLLLASPATSAPLRRLGAHIAGAAASVELIVVEEEVALVAEGFSIVEAVAAVCLTEVEVEVFWAVVVGIAVAAVSVAVEGVGVEVVSVDFVVGG